MYRLRRPNSNFTIRFSIDPVPPFRLDLTVWTLRREPSNNLDRWDGRTYTRLIEEGNILFEVRVRQSAGDNSPSLDVEVAAAKDHPELRERATRALKRLLGLDIDIADFYRFTAGHKKLENLVGPFRGVKPPQFPTFFETLANGIIFQQISLPAGVAIMNRVVAAYGATMVGAGGNAFPSPETVARLSIDNLRAVGFSGQKGRALTELASRIVGGLRLEQTETMTDAEAIDFLCRLRGIGRWTAQYFLLRGLGRLHVFPADDVGARNKARKYLGMDGAPETGHGRDMGSRWDRFGGLIYFHLLLNHLAERGYVG